MGNMITTESIIETGISSNIDPYMKTQIADVMKKYARVVIDHLMAHAPEYISEDEYGAHFLYEKMDELKKQLL